MRTLFQDVRSEQNIFSAWRHVKRSALSSKKDETKGAASEFEHAHQRHLRRIISELRNKEIIFDPVTGVLKDKKKRLAAGKDPRPLAIGSLKNRIIQRAILQVLQPRTAIDPKEPDTRYQTRLDQRLGKINDVNQSRFGVGGLIYPYGGVTPAIKLIREAIDSGAKYYFRSDIRAFFTKIPTQKVIDFVQTETNDYELSDLFAKALEVHLANTEDLQGYAQLFPQNGIGVAQGSSLSAFAGNVLLYSLDHELNSIGVTAVRYIDDILIVSGSNSKLDSAIQHAKSSLEALGFGLYTPNQGGDKAAQGECADAIHFLGCTIQPNRCVPSVQSIDRLKESIKNILSTSKAAIKDTTKSGKPLKTSLSFSATLDSVGKKTFGWQKSFSFCTDHQPFKLLDDFVAKQINDYTNIVYRYQNGCSQTTRMKVLGIPSTQEMFLLDKKKSSGSKSKTA